VAIAAATKGAFLLLLLPLALMYFRVQRLFRLTSTEVTRPFSHVCGSFLFAVCLSVCFWFGLASISRLQVERLSKISRSPIFADFSQTLAGAPAIRAYGCAGRFVARAERAMDANNACVVVVQLCFSWLSIRLDAIGTQK
jgi:ATP-binding cassette subfamily C (CFTR/MRP) protein 1